ncbi:glycosyltransferase [bacterium]|nr:glycosyltransferase [bacterium]
MRNIFFTLFKFLDHPHHSEAKSLDYSSHSGDFLFLPEIHSAKKHLYSENISFMAVSLALFILAVVALSQVFAVSFLASITAFIALLYFCYNIFKIVIISRSRNSDAMTRVSPDELMRLRDEDLPTYTILIPLYREEKVICQILHAMNAIDYPTEKLDIVITLEEYDHPTREAIEEIGVPPNWRIVMLPDVKPKTKPKALNVAVLKAYGELLVIYDAEIIPDPDQLKKAAIAFRHNPNIAALQTRLDHYNPRQSWVTRLFNAEFSFYYDLFLPGLQSSGYPLPLSGHSTHFRTEALYYIGAWDPYNVTEDCDVGMRLFRKGYRTGMLDSVSREESVTSFHTWILQRTRWMKGFIQTSIVHLRHPFRFKNEIGGWKNVIAFFFLVPGTVLVNIINFFFWILLVVWLVFHPAFIQSMFPGPVLYLSVASFVVGNFLFTLLNLLASYRRGRFDLVKYGLLSFWYWIMLAIATLRGAVEIVFKPHYWEKTTHGSHLEEGKHLIITKA